ncbi:hypothetical protein SLEP1_g29608 [Rubroshorea leprosula]|uniref:RNase H type-1 domain-containing protein n=1 Tax=Rubroshorea leprosula TaxID=152421 RepID=A0AAV5JXF0_9ROSI|nr:hypothetical protein SLEP1_g29608 [Rubroshorea leprosula]
MASNPARRDQTRFCAFHGEHGHDTEECRQLKIEIERLIRRGALRQFVKTNDSSRNRKDQHKKPGEKEKEEEQPLEVVGTINIVSLPSEVRSKEKTPSVTLEAKNSLRKSEVISFTEKDLQQREVYPHEPLMIQVIVEDRNLRQGKILKRILVDTGSCRDILTHEVFKKLGFSTQFMRPCEFPLVGLFGKEVPVVGIITIPIHVGDTAQKAVVTLDFFVVDIPCSFNAILGRPGLNALQAVISTSHMMIKFPTPKGIGVARGRSAEIQETVTAQVSEQSETRKLRPKSRAWDLIATGDIGRRRALTVDTMDAREGINEQRAEPIDRTKSVVLTSKNPNKTTNVGADMDPKFTAKLEECLRRHEDIFAGSAADMPGIDPKVACHRLGVPPEAVPVRQKMRQFGAERTAAIKEEVEKLKKAGFIKEINFCEWLSNVVMVKKANGKWRMCIDFTDLNKVCPKDNYALPNIDELVDNSSGYEVLSFCDAYSGYNQIPLAEEDQDKTAFIAAGETYCYIVMPFGLKNAVLTNYPLRHVLHKPDLAGRLVKWSIELTEFDVEFQPRKATKAQILVDFIVELSKEEKAALDTPLPTPPAKRQSSEVEEEQARVIPPDLCWVLHVDGSSSENGSGAGIILTSPEGETFEYALKFTFEASNNRAEYEALLGGLRK